jgi:hypothetical protein
MLHTIIFSFKIFKTFSYHFHQFFVPLYNPSSIVSILEIFRQQIHQNCVGIFSSYLDFLLDVAYKIAGGENHILLE